MMTGGGGTRGGQVRVCGPCDPRHQHRPQLVAVLLPRPSFNAVVNSTEDAGRGGGEARRHAADALSRGPGTAGTNKDTVLHFYVCKPHPGSI